MNEDATTTFRSEEVTEWAQIKVCEKCGHRFYTSDEDLVYWDRYCPKCKRREA